MTLLQGVHRRMGELLTCAQGYRACVCPPGIHDLESEIVSHRYSVPFAEGHCYCLKNFASELTQ